MPAVSVIVPARDAEATLARTLQALGDQACHGGHEVIVVDDGSRDATARLATAAGGRVRLVRQDARGPAEARNRGVAEASAPLLAFCDADVFPQAGWLAAGVAALGDADLVQGRVIPDPAAPLGPFDRTLWIEGPGGLWETANLFVTRAAFAGAGGFEQWIAPRRGKPLAEDVWFGHRALRAGARPAFCPQALAHHAVFPRGPRAYAAERARLRFFPAMAARMPELRAGFLHRHLFLNPRTARCDAALAGVAAAALTHRALPLAAGLPYARTVRAAAVARAAGGGSALAGTIAAVDVLADLIGAGALAYGSVRYRAPVI